jgi:hypothetical protein
MLHRQQKGKSNDSARSTNETKRSELDNRKDTDDENDKLDHRKGRDFRNDRVLSASLLRVK